MEDPTPSPGEERAGEERRKRWWTALGGTVVFVVLGLALAPGLARRERTPEPQPLVDAQLELAARAAEPAAGAAAAMAIQAPEADPVSQAFDCMIQPNEVIEIGSSITGLIEEILVERGDYVEEGQVLARLESSVEEAAVRVAKVRAQVDVELESSRANLELGRKRSERARRLFKENSPSLDLREGVETEATIAELELERARVNQRLASLQLEQAAADLQRRTIRSPVAGFVVERLMARGEVIDEQVLLRLAQIDPLRVEVILPSELFTKVERGDRAEIVPEEPFDRVRTAEVSIVDRVIDGASGTFGVRLLLPNPDHELPGGLRCGVRFLEDS